MEENPYKAPVEVGSALSISPVQPAPRRLRYRLGVAALILFDVVFVAPSVVVAVYLLCYWLWNRRWPA